MSSDRPAAGFTLIEMMVTITIVAILAAAAVPSFQQLIANQRIKTASFDLFSALNYARSEAIKRNASVTLRAGATGDGLWSTGWRLVDPADATKNLRTWGAINRLSVTEAAGVSAITFGLNGRVTVPSAAPMLSIGSSVSMTGLTSRCIQIDLSGRATTATGACT